ncbi:hypothetical protein CVS40_3235 [Lucilia cuprina]|nr:hypothetical protein CVS40_3235 [Lucilia cuprina]
MYPADTPIFDRTSVSLELPDRLFTNTFTTASNASKILGKFIKNSSRRFSYFAYFLKPIFGDALIIKDTAELALLNSTTTTTTVMPETSSETDSSFMVTTLSPEITTLMDELDETTINPLVSNMNEGTNEFEHKRVKRAGGKGGKPYPEDTPEFDRGNVSLDFPDELFNKSFATLTNVSKSISRLIMASSSNSARRYARFVLFFKPVFGDALVVQGFENPTTTTTTTIAPNDSLNEI